MRNLDKIVYFPQLKWIQEKAESHSLRSACGLRSSLLPLFLILIYVA